jgi:hypothetical protein
VPKLRSQTDTSNFANYDSEAGAPPVNSRDDEKAWAMWERVDTSAVDLHEVTAATRTSRTSTNNGFDALGGV